MFWPFWPVWFRFSHRACTAAVLDQALFRGCAAAFFFGLHASHAPLPARFYIEIVVNVKNIVGFVDFEDFGDIVYQAGAGTWGIPAASPLRREG